jgi:tungstate transport system substrate-binding protein
LRAGAGGLVAAGSLNAASGQAYAANSGAVEPYTRRSTVRVLSVGAALTGGLFNELVSDFADESRFDVEVTQAGQDIFDQARAGAADLVLAHLGFTELQDFVSEGRGQWPATVLSNTVSFLRPSADPAGIQEARDPFEAFQQIADQQLPFVINDLGETRYISDMLWVAARPDPGDWFLDLGLSGAAAVLEAERRGAYTLWGLHPFRGLKMQRPDLETEQVIYNDAIMQRIIASVVVKRAAARVNRPGARALERFLTAPATQARIRSLELPEIGPPVFWPAGNQNDN